MQFAIITAALLATAPMAFASPAPYTSNKAPEQHYLPTGVTFYNQPELVGQQLTVPIKYSKDHYRSDCVHSPELEEFTIVSAKIVAKEPSLHVCTVHKDSECKDPIIVIKGDVVCVEKAPSVTYVQCAFVGYYGDKHEHDKYKDKHADGKE